LPNKGLFFISFEVFGLVYSNLTLIHSGLWISEDQTSY